MLCVQCSVCSFSHCWFWHLAWSWWLGGVIKLLPVSKSASSLQVINTQQLTRASHGREAKWGNKLTKQLLILLYTVIVIKCHWRWNIWQYFVTKNKMSSSNYRKKSRRSDHDARTSRRSKSADPPQVSLPGEGRSHPSSKMSKTESSGDSNNEKLLVALRIRPLKNEEMSRGYESVATKVDSKVRKEWLVRYKVINGKYCFSSDGASCLY